MTTLEPGLYPDLSWDDYVDIDLPSQSILKQGLKSMAHVHDAREKPRPMTEQMKVGSALHLLLLEPASFDEGCAVWKGKTAGGRAKPRAGKDWDAFRRMHDGKIIINEKQLELAREMNRAILRHPLLARWGFREFNVRTEVTAINLVHGLLCKGRADLSNGRIGMDIKTCQSAGRDEFRRAVFTYGYHIQDAMYRDLFDFEEFFFLAVESEHPHDVVIYELDEEVRAYGRRQLYGLIDRYTRAVATGEWPGRSQDIETIDLPPWLVDDTVKITRGS